jgi:TetR/AcrR family transcriptional regulator
MVTRTERRETKRTRILEAALRHFAEHGYEKARVEDLAAGLGIAKGSVFQHFGSKDGLFLAAYKAAVAMLPSYLDAPEDVRSEGFFATLRYWLRRTDHLVREDWVPYRMTLLGNYGTDLKLRRDINRFLAEEDPYGTTAFVRLGIDRGEVRKDVDEEMVVSILDWTMDRFQDALLTAELDPGLFRRTGERPERTEARIEQFLEILKGAIGAPNVTAARRSKAAPRRSAAARRRRS